MLGRETQISYNQISINGDDARGGRARDGTSMERGEAAVVEVVTHCGGRFSKRKVKGTKKVYIICEE